MICLETEAMLDYRRTGACDHQRLLIERSVARPDTGSVSHPEVNDPSSHCSYAVASSFFLIRTDQSSLCDLMLLNDFG
jgi:hypothetical protein